MTAEGEGLQKAGRVGSAGLARRRRTEALAEIAQAVARVDTPEEWARRVVAAVANATDWGRVFIFRLGEGELRLAATWGVAPEDQERSRSLPLDGPSLSARAVSGRAPLVTGRSTLDDEAQYNVRRQKIGGYAVFPLIARGRVFGSLTLLDDRPRRVGDAEFSFIEAAADTIATGLESAELYAAVEAASRAKDEFLSVASHELRTPLTPLKGLTQTLLRHMEQAAARGESPDLQRIERYLRSMDGQVSRLAGLVNDLLDVSRIRTGRLDLRQEETDLVALTRTVLARFEAMEHHTLRFTPRVDQLVGRWDAARLEQVVTNLVSNALKYTPDGGVVHVVVAPVHGAADEAVLSVRDPGIGIPPLQLAELFRPFHRLRNAPPEHFSGMGLGLFISHDIVVRHGGRIWAESPGPGEGSTFHVLLPREPVDSGVPAVSGAAARATG